MLLYGHKIDSSSLFTTIIGFFLCISQPNNTYISYLMSDENRAFLEKTILYRFYHNNPRGLFRSCKQYFLLFVRKVTVLPNEQGQVFNIDYKYKFTSR